MLTSDNSQYSGLNYRYTTAAISVEFLPWLEAEAKQRQGTRTDIVEKIPQSEKGKAREKAAAMTGTNGRYVSDAKRIHDTDPDAFAEIKEGKKTINQVRSEQRLG